LFFELILDYNDKKFKGGGKNMASVFEEKNISKAIIRVGLPAMLGQLTTLIYNIAYTCDYLKYIFIGAPFIMLANGFVHLFRSVGLIKESTIGLMLGNVINIVLDYIFIAIAGWGTAGAALATSLGFVCATIYYIACMIREEYKGNQLVPLIPKHFLPNAKMIRNVVSIGILGALITVLMSVSNIVLNNYISIYGSNAVASYGIAYKLDMIPILLSVGLSQGVTPLVGYYYGKNECLI
jgi:multidrug efflux pump